MAGDILAIISVGAGISDWMTYYVNTDMHPFTRQYLKATPWEDAEIYAKTSPITDIKGEHNLEWFDKYIWGVAPASTADESKR